MIRFTLISLMVVALSACTLTQQGFVAPPDGGADAGPYPDNYRAAVQSYLQSALRDPGSIKDFRLGKPVQDTRWFGLVGGGSKQVWAVCGELNAKNAYGGYTGLQRWEFLFRDGKILTANSNIRCTPAGAETVSINDK